MGTRSSQARRLAELLADSEATLADDPNASLRSALKAQELAQKLGDMAGRAGAVRLGGMAYNRLSRAEEAVEYLEGAAGLYEIVADPRNASLTQFQLGVAYENLGRLTEAMSQFRKSLEIARPNNLSDQIGDSALAVGRIFTKLADPGHALDYFYEALTIFESRPGSTRMPAVLLALGNVHYQMGRFEKALEYHMRALMTTHPGGDGLSAKCCNNIGADYGKLGDHGRALEYHQRSLESIRPDDAIMLAKCYNNIGADYSELGEHDRALEYHRKALGIQEQIGGPDEICLCLNNIGSVYDKKGDYELALEYYLKALEKAQRLKNNYLTSIISVNAGLANMMLGRLDPASDRLTEGLRVAEMVDCDDLRMDARRALASLHEKRGDFAIALEHQRTFAEIQERVYKKRAGDSLNEFQMRLDVDRMTFEKRELQQRLDFQNSELQTMAVQLAQKNELLERLKAEMSQGDRARRADDALGRLNAIFETRKDWSQFKGRFEEIHPGFVSELTARFPSLTRQEIRICILVKIRLTTSMIAKALFLSQRSIENHRYRIRRKIGLARDEDLARFLELLPISGTDAPK